MATVGCPMCGKPNPAEAEVCQFCSARIKPLRASEPKPTPPSGSTLSTTPKSSESESDLPDWLRSLRSGEGQEISPEADTNFAFRDTLEGGGEKSPDVEDTQAEMGNENLDWLSRIRERARTEKLPDEPQLPESNEYQDHGDLNKRNEVHFEETARTLPPSTGESESTGEIPDWLKDLSSPAATPAPASKPVEKELLSQQSTLSPSRPAFQEEVPSDWLSQGQGPPLELGARPEPESNPAQPSSAWDVQLPDWLADATGTSFPPAQKTTGPASPGLDNPLPPGQTAAFDSSYPASAGEFSVPAPAQPQEDASPDWLKSLGKTDFSSSASLPFIGAGDLNDEADQLLPGLSAPSEEAFQNPSEPAGGDQSIPDWLKGVQPDIPTSLETPSSSTLAFSEGAYEERVQAFPAEELPDWMAQMRPPESEPANPEANEDQPAEEEITLPRADLPSWVQAMRPVETATPKVPAAEEKDDRIENLGPLAGLRGVLPGDALPANVQRPSVYSVKLQVSEKQRTSVSLLETMLANEDESQPVVPPVQVSKQIWLRITIAIILILGVVIPTWTGSRIVDLPGYTPPETQQFQTSLAALPADAPVLVAIDYEPALAGEMETASTGVVSELINRSTNLVLVSTNPSGQILGDQLIQKVLFAQKRFTGVQPSYSSESKILNLGFLVGGPAALLNFAIYPQIAAPFTANGIEAWTQPILSNVHALSDFALVIVITDNAETARNWVEQVQPSLMKTPLFIVASAQVAPVITTYIETGQVQGVIAGATGGAIYERVTQNLLTGRGRWDSYQAGIIIAILVLLVGGIVSLVTNIMTGLKHNKGN